MSDVLFGQSYYLRFDPKLWDAMQPYPPLGCLIAAASLRSRGLEVAVFDAMLAGSEAEWGARLRQESPRFAVLFEDNFNYLSKMCLLRMREAAFTMIDMARAQGATVIVCGSDSSDHAEQYLARGAEYVLLGEGEETLAELMDHLTGRGGRAPQQIAGLAVAGANGGPPHATVRRAVIDDLDALPVAAWDLVDVDRYRQIWQRRHGYFSMNMVTTRGCPYHCNWCAKPIWGQTYHMRSPENVVAELSRLKATYAPDHIWFADDIMGLKRGWMARFAELVEAAGVKTPFKSLSRADLLLREGEVEALRRAGCEIVWVGAESGSQRVLDAMDKGTRVEQVVEAAARVHAAGLRIGFFLQFGYPGEEWEDIEQTFELVRAAAPDEIGMSVSYPLPGTKFYDLVRLELGSKRNWIDSADLDMMYRGRFTTPFYRQLCRVMQKEFQARQAAARVLGPGVPGLERLRKAAAFFRHRGSLPVARRKLRRLARVAHRGVGPLDSGMSPEQAARPSPQASG